MFTAKLKRKIYFFVGTTTELIKLAPIIKELEKRQIKFKIITSGQTKVNFEELAFLINKKKADISLGEKQNRSSVIMFFFWSIYTIFKTPALKNEFKGLNKNNSYFIVHGDPVSSLIGAIIAKIYGLTLVHIESGLRSFNFLEPFPEEICRVIISKIADIHFCPNEWSIKNLSKEKGLKINTKQNTMIESCFSVLTKFKNLKIDLKVTNKKYFVLIVHRQEHVVFGKEKSRELIEHIIKNIPKNMKCVFITHATTMDFLNSVGFKLSEEDKKKVIFAPRLKYIEFVNLMNRSAFLITDGGSNQEEAYYMGLPCLLVRNYTERIEGLNDNVVLSKSNKRVISEFMKNYKKYIRSKIILIQKPSKIIVDTLVNYK